MTHSPTPWALAWACSDESGRTITKPFDPEPDDAAVITAVDANGKMLESDPYDGVGDNWPHIVACVNAMVGIPDELLPYLANAIQIMVKIRNNKDPTITQALEELDRRLWKKAREALMEGRSILNATHIAIDTHTQQEGKRPMFSKALRKLIRTLWSQKPTTIDNFRQWQLTHLSSRVCAMHPADYADLLDWFRDKRAIIITDNRDRIVLWGTSLIPDKSISQGVFLPR